MPLCLIKKLNNEGDGVMRTKKIDSWRDSNDYREEYFRKNPGLFGVLYFCSQCYKPLVGRHNVQVDHIYPPSRLVFKKGPFAKGYRVVDRVIRSFARMFGFKIKAASMGANTSLLAEAMNTSMQSVAICPKCNKKKSNKVGLVTVKGFVAKIMETILFKGQALIVLVIALTTKLLYFVLSKLFKILAMPFTGKSKWQVKVGFAVLYVGVLYYCYKQLL